MGTLVELRLIVDVGAAEEGGTNALVAEQLASLDDWLRYEEELRGRTRLVNRDIAEGQMGGLAEVLTVALSVGGAGTVLANAVVAWIRQRTSDVKVKAVRPDGTSFEVDLRRSKDPDALVRLLAEFVTREQRADPAADETP